MHYPEKALKKMRQDLSRARPRIPRYRLNMKKNEFFYLKFYMD